MLNRALRLMEVDIIIGMGFFLKDIHNDIVQLHAEQFGAHQHSNSFPVYRGQGLSSKDFNELKQTQGGLFTFNNFLSTSMNQEVSLKFARRTISTSDLVGVLFVIEINPKMSTTPFANVKNVSYLKGEDEILFSMHSIFRIGQIKQLDGNARLWQVNLTLTSDNDPQLYALTEQIRKETYPDKKGWIRLAELLIKLGEFDKAEQICNILLDQTTNIIEQGHIYHTLGWIMHNQGEYEDAVEYYEQSKDIFQQYLSSNHPNLASSYNNLGLAYKAMGKYSEALPYYEEAVEIYRKTLPENHPLLATSYNNIGAMYDKMEEYSKALLYLEKALELRRETLPEYHTELATSYNNIASVYDKMGEYSKALSYFEKALEIDRKTLPENHPLLGTTYNNIGLLFSNMGENSKALSYYTIALDIYRKALPENHPALGNCYNNIGLVYRNMNDYRNALQNYECALDILQRVHPPHHYVKTLKESIDFVKSRL